MTPQEQQHRLDMMTRDRMFGLTIRAIARRYSLSKTQVHRLVGDVAVVHAPRRSKPEVYSPKVFVVPCADGLGYRAVTLS